jgi:hypothetical protein
MKFVGIRSRISWQNIISSNKKISDRLEAKLRNWLVTVEADMYLHGRFPTQDQA